MEVSNDTASLIIGFDKGKHFTAGELTYLPVKDVYQFTVMTLAKIGSFSPACSTVGKQKEQILTLERSDPSAKEDQRLVITLLHHNRFLYRFETKPTGAEPMLRTEVPGRGDKEGEPFADVPKGPECFVSGGLGKIPVTYKGKTYHVCCSGCRDAFKDDPEKWIKEFEAKKK